MCMNRYYSCTQMRGFKKKDERGPRQARVSSMKPEAAASSSEDQKLKMMAAAASAVDVDLILRVKKEAMDAMETESGADKEKKAPEEEKKKKKKVVTSLVPQSHIDYMKAEGLYRGVEEIPEDELAKESQRFRERYRAEALLAEKLRAYQQVLLDQYDGFGYAYDAKEVTDDEGDDEGEVALKN